MTARAAAPLGRRRLVRWPPRKEGGYLPVNQEGEAVPRRCSGDRSVLQDLYSTGTIQAAHGTAAWRTGRAFFSSGHGRADYIFGTLATLAGKVAGGRKGLPVGLARGAYLGQLEVSLRSTRSAAHGRRHAVLEHQQRRRVGLEVGERHGHGAGARLRDGDWLRDELRRLELGLDLRGGGVCTAPGGEVGWGQGASGISGDPAATVRSASSSQRGDPAATHVGRAQPCVESSSVTEAVAGRTAPAGRPAHETTTPAAVSMGRPVAGFVASLTLAFQFATRAARRTVVPSDASMAVMMSTVPAVAVQLPAGPRPARRGAPLASAFTGTPALGNPARSCRAR